jgi:hypothetical protein
LLCLLIGIDVYGVELLAAINAAKDYLDMRRVS